MPMPLEVAIAQNLRRSAANKQQGNRGDFRAAKGYVNATFKQNAVVRNNHVLRSRGSRAGDRKLGGSARATTPQRDRCGCGGVGEIQPSEASSSRNSIPGGRLSDGLNVTSEAHV